MPLRTAKNGSLDATAASGGEGGIHGRRCGPPRQGPGRFLAQCGDRRWFSGRRTTAEWQEVKSILPCSKGLASEHTAAFSSQDSF
jgi:ribosomal protein S27AE